jgi:hypothetical protein
MIRNEVFVDRGGDCLCTKTQVFDATHLVVGGQLMNSFKMQVWFENFMQHHSLRINRSKPHRVDLKVEFEMRKLFPPKDGSNTLLG